MKICNIFGKDAHIVEVADIMKRKGGIVNERITQLRVGDPVDHFLLIKQSTKGVTTSR